MRAHAPPPRSRGWLRLAAPFTRLARAAAAFQAAIASNPAAVVLDTRQYDEFWAAEGHIVGAVNIQGGAKGGESKTDGTFAVRARAVSLS